MNLKVALVIMEQSSCSKGTCNRRYLEAFYYRFIILISLKVDGVTVKYIKHNGPVFGCFLILMTIGPWSFRENSKSYFLIGRPFKIEFRANMPNACWLESVQDFLIKFDMKPCLVEISIFSLNSGRGSTLSKASRSKLRVQKCR